MHQTKPYLHTTIFFSCNWNIHVLFRCCCCIKRLKNDFSFAKATYGLGFQLRLQIVNPFIELWTVTKSHTEFQKPTIISNKKFGIENISDPRIARAKYFWNSFGMVEMLDLFWKNHFFLRNFLLFASSCTDASNVYEMAQSIVFPLQLNIAFEIHFCPYNCKLFTLVCDGIFFPVC